MSTAPQYVVVSRFVGPHGTSELPGAAWCIHNAAYHLDARRRNPSPPFRGTPYTYYVRPASPADLAATAKVERDMRREYQIVADRFCPDCRTRPV
jgi:hypothetical protein